ncbi:hypothetical protein HMPREF1011_02177 [Anaerostipes caccae]|uniref:efflux RND transporter permease subunit n=1 Tax=Anaerostipes caccae TaxID=105841 RepID=UPI0001F011AC|nr:efflux RND transporter permease subunit [Anaerostipes caccae]EFV22013.1 hypothetical protein HMPREF1011_02177 [Anaerostipes caccae]
MFSKFSVRKPYTVIVGVILVIILGIVSFSKMTTDLLPSMELPYALVMTTYQGASPEEVETTVTKPVEQAMATISNIKQVASSSSENMSVVYMEFEGDANMDSAALDMREKLDMIKGYWPDKVGNPTIMKLNPDMMPVLVTAIDSDNKDMSEISKLIKDKVSPGVEAVEGVASVSETGMLEENINVIINEDKIKSLNKKIQKALDGQFDEAQDELDRAKAKLDGSKAQLNSKRTELNDTLAKAQTALNSGKLSLAQKEVEVTSVLTNLQNQKKALELVKQAGEEGLKQLEAQLKTVTDPAQKAQLQAQITEIKKQLKTADSTIKTLDKNIEVLQKALKQIQKGKKQIDANLTTVTAQTANANSQMTSGEIGIAQGESQIAAGQQQLDASKKAGKSGG